MTMERTRWGRGALALGAALLVVALPAAAANVPAGTKVYVKAKNSRLQKSPTSDSVVAVLQPGDVLLYGSPDPKDGRWHLVTTVDKKKGYLFASNLSLQAVKPENLTGGAVSEKEKRAFASSGAATKALGDGAVALGEKSPDTRETMRRLLAVEAVAVRTTDAQLAEHARKAGLSPMVGPRAKLAQGGK